jgi:hypothetical protein
VGNTLGAARASRKAPTLSVQEPQAWRTFRVDFEDARQINGWNRTRSRRELRMALQGPVRQLVDDMVFIPAGVDEAAMPEVAVLLNAIEARICPPGDSDVDRINFRQAQQEPGEPVMEWLGRCRSLYARANPAVPHDQLDGNRTIIDQFILGMTSVYMKTRTWERRPANLTDAGNFAVNLEAGQRVVSGTRAGLDPKVNAVQQENHEVAATGKMGPCYFCGRTNHQLRDCRELTALKKKYEEEKGRRGQGRRGHVGRGRFSGSFQWRRDREDQAGRGGRGRGGFAGKRGGRQTAAMAPSSTDSERAENLLRKLDLNREPVAASVSTEAADTEAAWQQYYSLSGNE